jgi:hypothetical protein
MTTPQQPRPGCPMAPSPRHCDDNEEGSDACCCRRLARHRPSTSARADPERAPGCETSGAVVSAEPLRAEVKAVPPPEQFLACVTDPAAVTAAQVGEATTRVLEDPAYRQAARRVAAEIAAAPPPTSLVPGSRRSQARISAARPRAAWQPCRAAIPLLPRAPFPHFAPRILAQYCPRPAHLPTTSATAASQ